MTLQELIDILEKTDEKVIPIGFNNPHSYRGYYAELAFEPARNVNTKDMLKDARDSLCKTFCGYKGGEYTMHECTEVYLAKYSETGEAISALLLGYMLGDESLIENFF